MKETKNDLQKDTIENIIRSCRTETRKVSSCEECLHYEIKDCEYLYEYRRRKGLPLDGWRNDWRAVWHFKSKFDKEEK